MADVKGVITKKIGPLPLWSYVVAGAAAVFLLGRFKGSGSSGGGDSAGTIRIPTLAGGSPSSPSAGSDGGDGAIGSPGQNLQGGMDTQPSGAPPWWSTPPRWWGATAGQAPEGAVTGNIAAQSSASVGRIDGRTAQQLAAEPAGGWKLPPLFQKVSPDKVIDASTLQTGQGVGGVNPANTLQGYSNPVTGEFRKDPFPGASAMWR